MKAKVLIVYGSIGLGHKVVAENIAATLKEEQEVEVKMLDVLEMHRGALTKISTKVYEWMIKYVPFLWRFLYTNRIFQKLTLPLRVPFAATKSKKISKFVATENPDLILTTHPNATALVAYLKREKIYLGPLMVTFSDFHFQPFWVFPYVDHYLVMTSEQQIEVRKRGFLPEQITVTGLPVDPVFSKAYDEGEILREFGLKRRKPIILVMGGSRGWGVREEDVETLLSTAFEVQVAVVTGKNKALEKKLRALGEKHPKDLKVFGAESAENVAKLFAVAKILVTKPGGLTIAQALLKTIPMILVNPLPTMEELNEAYLLQHGAAVAAKSQKELKFWVEWFLQDKKYYQDLRKRMKNLSAPDAAKIAAEAIIDMLKREA